MPLQQRVSDETSDVLTVDWSLSQPAIVVWEHLTDPVNLPEWLGEPQVHDGNPGGVIRIDHGDGYVCTSIVNRIDPASFQFEVTWEFPDEPRSRVEVHIQSPSDSESVLTLRHLDLGDLRDSYAQGWVTHLTFLEASLNDTPLPMSEFWNLHATTVALGKESAGTSG